MSEERFLSVLREAKDLFLEKSQAEKRLVADNEKLLEVMKQLEIENEKLVSENKRLVEHAKSATENLERATEEVSKLTEKNNNSKKFVKVYFKDQLNRMKEIEKKGIYNAETFSYLIGDIGRSLCNTTLNEGNNESPTNRKPGHGKLSINKQNSRARYEEVQLWKDCGNPSNILDKNSKQTTIRTGKWQDIFYNGKRHNETSNKNKQTVDISKKRFSSQEHLKNYRAASNNNFNLEMKNCRPQKIENFLDPNITLSTPIGPPFECSTQIESSKDKGKFDNITQSVVPGQGILKSERTISNADDSNPLDPELTLRSPIGPPSKSSTPQDPTSGEEPKKFTLTFSPPQTSPSLLSNEDNEGVQDTLLPQILLIEGEVPEETQPQSPTILTRSHSLTRTTSLVAPSPAHRTPKRKRDDISFGSLFGSDSSHEEKLNDSRVLDKARSRHPNEDESRKHFKLPIENRNSSPDIIVLEDSDFIKPSCTSVPRKKPQTSLADESSANTSSLLFCSPKTSDVGEALSSAEIRQSDNKSNEMDQNENVEQIKPKIALNFNLDESIDDEKNSYRDKKNCPQYKYKEVVRGKDKRAKLNGYFCADCEKYYGSLKLSEAEMQERLKACSKHRARFSPPPSTPEHFWEVDFMNTNEYIEKGYMRTEYELPPEKRKLRSRKLRLGKQQK